MSIKNKKTIGVVLAGGLSSRMGEDKALLNIDAETMLTRTVNMLQQTSVSKVLVSRNSKEKGHMADILPGKGPLSGIHSMVTRFPSYNLIVVPVDLPLIDTNTIQQLIDYAQTTMKNVRYKSANLPLYIQNTASFRQVLDYTLKFTDCYSVQRLCTHFPMAELDSPIASKLYNTNTPEQWLFATQHFGANQVAHECNNNVEGMHESFK